MIEKLSKTNGVSEDNILITSGIDGGIKTIFEMCTTKSSSILCITPTYAMYQVYADAYDINIINICSRSDLTINVDEIIGAMDHSIDVVFIPNPHIPIEYVFSKIEIKRILDCAKQYEILVVVDEAYYMFGAPTMVDLICEYKNLLVARTFSKGFGLAAIRLGYLAGNPEIISYLSTRRFAHETNMLTCQIAVFALDNITLFQSYANDVVSSRDWVKNELNKLGFESHGSKSNTILLDLETHAKAMKVSKMLSKSGYLVKSNIPEPFNSYILFTVGTKKTMMKFLPVLMKSLNTVG